MNKQIIYIIKTVLKQIVISICLLLCILNIFVTSSVKTFASAASLKELFNSIFGTTQTQEVDMPYVYLGGMPLGFTLECDGVIVVAVGQVHTVQGVVNTIVSGSIENGDIVTKIDNQQINSVKVIEDCMQKQNQQNREVQLDIIDKNNNLKQVLVLPAKDIITNQYKLGLWVRDNSAGVGTLTYIREDNLRFGALGHSVCDIDTGRKLPLYKGNIFKCNIIGVEPSKKGYAGELKGLFLRNGSVIGSVDKNIDCGVYGKADELLVSGLQKLKVATKNQVKTGRAQIYCCVQGNKVQSYNIEIIKTTRQNTQSNKSMIIRITDTNLIADTGGIVQGMSGSPIVQNGLLVGAVTHVFVSDPTKGYGVYADWMLENDH